jgi:hypothetical protein
MARTKRPTNPELCADFRALLTDRAKASLDESTLAVTKGWRGELWKAFREIEDRLLPLEALARRKAAGEDTSEE